MGKLPKWYTTITVGQYYGIPPWEVDQAPLFWHKAALIAMAAEGEASKERERRQQR